MYIEYYEDIAAYFNNGASCYLARSIEDNVFTFWSLQTKSIEMRGKGLATAILKEVQRHSESTGIPVRLVAAPFGDCPLSLGELKRFYSKNGFVNTDRDEFYYYPQSEIGIGL